MRTWKGLRGLSFVAATAMALAVLNPAPAQAGWGWYGCAGGCWGGCYAAPVGCYGCYSGYACHGCYGCYGGYGCYGAVGCWGCHGGPVRNFVHHVFHPFEHLRYRAYCGCASCVSCVGTVRVVEYGCWSSCGCSCSCSCSGATYYRTPMGVPQAEPAAPDAAPKAPEGTDGLPAPTTQTSLGGSAVLTVDVPEGAKVFVNGRATKSTGANRQYVSRGLVPGMTYTYEVRVESEVDGKIAEDTKVVHLKAGDTSDLTFDLQPRPETVLTVNVPADAKVSLAGNDTSASGAVRVFRTSSLSAGQEWTDYVVSVTIERDGKPVTQEQTISLKAGEQKSLDFSFDAEKVAAAH
ncbi:MAG: TIGR03000 domain-containing protein [Planctomycetes bacterium]|nr:TIGR03000 domain-containing protein [Planctomycetota bacterium]